MTQKSDSLIESLLHEDEGTALDFKREQYRFDGAGKEQKGELLKDILAFANSWRQSTAYILIGVNENPDGRGVVVGISDDLDDAKLQQFMNSKTNRPLTFTYRAFHLEGKKIGVIEIPVQDRPIYLNSNYGKVEKESVYIRRGSSTAIATLEEIIKMAQFSSEPLPPNLSLEWADLTHHKVLPSPCELNTVLLNPKLPKNTFKKNLPRGNYDHISPSSGVFDFNHNYSSEIIDYTFSTHLHEELGFQLQNRGEAVARRVRFVGTVKRQNDVVIKNWGERVRWPHIDLMQELSDSIVPFAEQLRKNPDPSVNKYKDHWEITIEFGDIRPHDEVWTTTPVLVGAVNEGSIVVDGELRGDNIPSPITCQLEAKLVVQCRPMEKADVQQYMTAEDQD